MNRIIITLISIALLVSCSHKIYLVRSCNLISEQNGTLTLRSVGYGRQKVMAMDDAETNALETLLFRGVPGTQYSSPLIEIDEVRAKESNPKYFNDLLKYARSKSFITSSVPVSEYSRSEYNTWTISVDVTINVVPLRKDLEAHGIIRKFGL